MPLHVKLTQFEGPLALLLELIEAKKLEISEISLAEVTDQYLVSIKEMTDVPPIHVADFLVVASQLLLIKSRILLPGLLLSSEEEGEVQDLELALQEYKRYRGASRTIKDLISGEGKIAVRQLWQGIQGGFFPPHDINPTLLERALSRAVSVLERFLQPLDQTIARQVMSIEAKIKEVLKRIEKKASATLRNLAGSPKKLDVIVAFLAILFLFKEKTIQLTQVDLFSEIQITKNRSAS